MTPHNHTISYLPQGCPLCNESKLEKEIRELLNTYNVKYIQQYRDKWLGRQSLDFYLPQYNIAIECQGDQHFTPVDFSKNDFECAKKLFQKNIYNDLKKYKNCINNQILLLYFTRNNLYEKSAHINILLKENIYANNLFFNKEDILNFILKEK
jgi:hypothetical protein